MVVIDSAAITEDVLVSSEYLFLPGDAELCSTVVEATSDKSGMREVAEKALSLMGLGEVLRPGDASGDIIMKKHEMVSGRDAAVAEQFFHADVAVNGLCGVFLIGLEGSNPEAVPETRTVDNVAMLKHIMDFVEDGPLEDRLDEVFVVRPYFHSEDRSEWMNYPRHVLNRLSRQPFWELLTSDQAQHVDRDRERVLGTVKYIGDVFISKLISQSVIDGTPMPTCGVSSREIRLALEGLQTEEETDALSSLHDEITLYLLGSSVVYQAQKVIEGSALFVPTNQLHRATPYNPLRHKRSIVAVKCYPGPNHPSPVSWEQAQGIEY